MKIQVNTDNSVEGDEAMARTVETTIHAGLDRYDERLIRVEAHIGDEDGTSGNRAQGIAMPAQGTPIGHGSRRRHRLR